MRWSWLGQLAATHANACVAGSLRVVGIVVEGSCALSHFVVGVGDRSRCPQLTLRQRSPAGASGLRPQQREVPPDVAQVRPLLLEDHADAVPDGGMPVVAAPRVVALLMSRWVDVPDNPSDGGAMAGSPATPQ